MLSLLMILGVLGQGPTDPARNLDRVGPSILPAAFQAWFQKAADKKLTIPEDVLQVATQHRYVFIGGLKVGAHQGYLAQNAKQLRARGVPDDAIHIIQPSSQKTSPENAEAIRAELTAIAAKGPERLVVIAHSRGACDALVFALENPAFVTKHVEALFLVQGPFGGTGVADYVAGDGPAADSQMPMPYRVAARAIGRLEAELLDKDKHRVITSLSHEESGRYWEAALERHRKALPVVSPRTFYVTSRTKPSHHPVLQRVTAWYLGTYYGPNDGLVGLDDQTLPEVGTVLAVVDAGHTDLTHRFPAARPRARLRKALVDAILMAVGTQRGSLTETSFTRKTSARPAPRNE